MAKFGPNTQASSVAFAGGPVLVEIASSSLPSGAKMGVLKLQVDVDAGDGRTPYIFSMDADDGRFVTIDISSAIRSALASFAYTTDWITQGNSLQYPKASYGLTVWEEYMLNGEMYETAKLTYQGTGTAILGGLSEFDRFSVIATPDQVISKLKFFTRKPSGDVCRQGEKVLVSKYADGVVNASVYSTDGLSGKQSLGGWDVTVLPASDYIKQFLFVNSLGVMENTSAMMREALTYGVDSETYSLNMSPAYRANASIITQKTAPRGKFQMSSGFVNRYWADWWTTEFLCSPQHWMLYGKGRKVNPSDGSVSEFDLWIPCAVSSANDSVQIYNRAKQELPHIDFNVELALDGSARNGLKF